MASILTSAEYVEVRAAIGTDVSPRDLSNAVIKLDLYQGAAERWARSIDATADSRQGDELRTLKTAIVLKTASLILPAFPHLVSEDFGEGESVRRQPVNIEERATKLAQRAQDTIGQLVAQESKPLNLPTMFTAAKGRRGL
jgi:hypothetical protein